MASGGKSDDFDALIREYVKEIVKEFTGAAACPGYTLPLGMAVDPESPTFKLKGKWPKPKAKNKRKKCKTVNEAITNYLVIEG